MRKLYLVSLSIVSFFLFFAGTIDLSALLNYSNQTIPSYINKDNTPDSNPITDEGATLGRVLFYDTNLSLNNTVSCASCHQQSLAFGDSPIQSTGHDGGVTGRHSPRLSSARFGDEEKFFWDERAITLENQATTPIQDHVEMGFSGLNSNPNIDSLIVRLSNIYYYNELFNLAFGNQTITEDRMQKALAQFVRSMQSFDSKYDIGRGQVNNNNANFPNFTTEENNGKSLFMSNNQTGCNSCHRAPEFDIDPNSNNNGIIGVAGSPGSIDITNERSPSLRDLANDAGVENGPYMHDGSLASLLDVINHYNNIPNNPNNTNLDNRLQGAGGSLNLTTTEKNELVAFLKTLGGANLYTDERWSDPFDANGNIVLLFGVLPIELSYFNAYRQDESINLSWETLIEINNDGFEILHSQDSKNWEVLDYIEGKNEAFSYKFTHINPSIGSNYYKLKQYDFDGRFNFSDTKLAVIEENDFDVNVYPNPTYNFIEIESNSNFESALIYNVNGQLLKEIGIRETSRIDMTDFESGVYFISLSGSASRPSKMNKVVKL